MPAANPFVAVSPNAGAVTPAPVTTSPGPMPTAGMAVGTGSLAGEHNCPLHIAAVIITALAVVFTLRALGFRFAVDASVGRGS